MKAAALAAGGDQTAQTRVFDIVRGAPWPGEGLAPEKRWLELSCPRDIG
jgi:hypothetical protein